MAGEQAEMTREPATPATRERLLFRRPTAQPAWAAGARNTEMSGKKGCLKLCVPGGRPAKLDNRLSGWAGRAGHPVRSIQTHPRSLLTWGLYDAPCLGTV